MQQIDLKINGKRIKTQTGKTVLKVAKENGIEIHTLCDDPRLKPFGACRLCLVEIEGSKKLMPACATQAQKGMVVKTNTARLQKIRKDILELLLSEHPSDCLVCESAGSCQLQDLAYRLEIEDVRFKGEKHHFQIEDDNPLIERDYNKCILCGKCARICNEVTRQGVYDFVNRGFETLVTTPFNAPLKESLCIFCGQCVSVCPVGALTEKGRKFKGREWEIEKTTSVCPYCGCGCEIEIETKNGKMTGISTELEKGVNQGNLCVKGKFGMDFVNHKDRLKTPLIRKKGKLVKASWTQALKVVADNLKTLKSKHGADAIAGLSSAKCTNEENYLMQKFMRAVIGTNNVDHCARLCHASTVVGLARAFGSGAMTNSIGDIADAEVIFVTGSNTTEAHPIIGYEIMRAVRDKGAKLIVMDPRKIKLAEHADIWMSQRSGTDVVVFNAMMNEILKKRLADKEFIKARTEGFDELKKAVSKYTPQKAERISGVKTDLIKKAARLYGKASRATIIYSMGITQHAHGTDNVLSIANLAMLTGNIGRPGTGVNPLRGQNNVQGACDMGALSNVYSGYQKVTDEKARKKFEEQWGCSLSGDVGLTVVEMIKAAEKGQVKAMYIMGENPMLSDPDITHVKKALKKLDFLVVQDIFLTETAQLADVVLPGTTSVEKDGTFTNTERRIQKIRKAIEPLGSSKPDWKIICEISKALDYPMGYASPAEVMDEIAQVTPICCGVSHERIEMGGLCWPCTHPEHPGTPILHVDEFAHGKGKFSAVEYKPPKEEPSKQYPLVLTTGRYLEHWHTGSMTRRSVGLDWICPGGWAEMHPQDAKKYKIKDGERIELETRRGKIKARAKVTEDARPGTVFLPFHFAEMPANKLTNPVLDPVAKIPEFKACAVKIKKISK